MHWRIHKIKQEKVHIKKLIDHLLSEAEPIINDEGQLRLFVENVGRINSFFAKCKACYTVEQIHKLTRISERYVELNYWKSYKTKYANKLKERLKEQLAASLERNQMAEHKRLRQLRDEAINDQNIISVFESTLTRTLGLEKDELTTDIIVVTVYFFDIIQDLILHGFEYQGEKYKFFTASAGQIRTKKTVFIKESLWNQHERTLMCGLSVDEINRQGGINVNKYLAYLALSNSATDHWQDFDIDRCIVVPDFEGPVTGMVDFIDDVTYEIDRQEMTVDIEHTDGCGMVLPSVSDKNFMVRLPWIKGLLASFDFRKFIEVNGCSPVVTDIYGDEHDIIAEDIQIIFTKSQFKMAKYFSDWTDYKDNFKHYHCQAGTCKEEEDYICSAHINYQMLQTLTEMTDEELLKIADPAIRRIRDLTSTVATMLDAFGADRSKPGLTPFQEALLCYPEMLNDSYCRETLKEIKKSLVIQYRAGKLPINGKFTFVVPDLYAFCQQLFIGMEHPTGLLADGEVSCCLYRRSEKLDCLRSPHLYKEHAVRRNVVNETTDEWFQTDAVYISCHDLISRILQCDFDGDTLLVVADKTIIDVAERSMKDIVPLFYNMKKAQPVILDNEQFYAGMTAAWIGGNIGVISNDITKIWNSKDEISEDELRAVKLLCMENNR